MDCKDTNFWKCLKFFHTENRRPYRDTGRYFFRTYVAFSHNIIISFSCRRRHTAFCQK